MGTANFHYKNRCIVVTDEDYEFDNLPPIKKNWNSHDGRELEVSDDFDFFDIYLYSGYYQHGNLDYERNDTTIEDRIGNENYYSTKKELFDAIIEEYPGLSKYRLNKLCGKIGNSFSEFFDKVIDKVTDYLSDKEELKVNKYLDGVKDSYGYDELRTIGRFSNGEALYAKI
jgi:hypothetical protein